MLGRYARWLHTGWPAGTVERLPEVREDGTTRLAGVRVVGDLTGIPLLKLALDGGARAIAAFLSEPDFGARRGKDAERVDVAIVGAGVSGLAAAIEAKAAGLSYRLFEASQPLSTLVNFPKGKPIFTYPTEMKPAGRLQVTANVKEALVEELERQRAAAGIEAELAHVDRLARADAADGPEVLVHFGERSGRAPLRALRVVLGIGRSGNYRRLGCPGEDLDKVYHRLYDPNDHGGQRALVVGGGDSALETAIALDLAGAEVTIAYRGKQFSRPKPENVEGLRALTRDPNSEVSVDKPSSERVTAAMSGAMRTHGRAGSATILFETTVKAIEKDAVVLRTPEGERRLPNDVVFAMTGREAPLDFFRRSGIPIVGEWSAGKLVSLAAFFLFALFVYSWKAGTGLRDYFSAHHWFPFQLPEHVGGSAFGHALGVSIRQPGFHYSLVYTLIIFLFGLRRIRRRKTPYITRQTWSLIAVQALPLFLLPYFILPTLGYLGAFDHGAAKTFADWFFPSCNYDYGREYWRAFGFVLAWPLFFWNFMTDRPMWPWLIVGAIQTFAIIPFVVMRWGKGAYCGWICSCGGLAETLGDEQRHKMPHGPRWNRLNLVGQVILLWVTLLFVGRAFTWATPASALGRAGKAFVDATFYAHAYYDYYHLVDIFLAGVVGVGLYFWFSGRTWCRFACPLAALMHVYARLGKFRIFADKKKCISCNVCTAVCHQGIDVMSFANKGLPMADPECVRCSACVQSCPTGTLSFGREGKEGPILDAVLASPVQIREGKTKLRVLN
jgi:thioredoxin reductase/Fe-S-cluster-containing hydrogenase component 2